LRGDIFREVGIKSNILILGNIFLFENFQVVIAYSLISTIFTMAGLTALLDSKIK
jgi:alanine racemase